MHTEKREWWWMVACAKGDTLPSVWEQCRGWGGHCTESFDVKKARCLSTSKSKWEKVTKPITLNRIWRLLAAAPRCPPFPIWNMLWIFIPGNVRAVWAVFGYGAVFREYFFSRGLASSDVWLSLCVLLFPPFLFLSLGGSLTLLTVGSLSDNYIHYVQDRRTICYIICIGGVALKQMIHKYTHTHTVFLHQQQKPWLPPLGGNSREDLMLSDLTAMSTCTLFSACLIHFDSAKCCSSWNII